MRPMATRYWKASPDVCVRARTHALAGFGTNPPRSASRTSPSSQARTTEGFARINAARIPVTKVRGKVCSPACTRINPAVTFNRTAACCDHHVTTSAVRGCSTRPSAERATVRPEAARQLPRSRQQRDDPAQSGNNFPPASAAWLHAPAKALVKAAIPNQSPGRAPAKRATAPCSVSPTGSR
jgi:hypothetical protein